MRELIEYVAAFDEVEAQMRQQAGFERQSKAHAQADADERNRNDTCDPRCEYKVYLVRTTIEPI